MLIKGFDIRKLAGAVWEEGKLGFEFHDCEDPVTEIKEGTDIWGLAGLKAPDQDEHDEQEENF